MEKELSLEEKIHILSFYKVDDSILNYLDVCFKNLIIKKTGDFEGNLLELMKNCDLEGWCWQTTESAILFLDDNDYIERGYLKARENYYHSWICFSYQDKSYVLDSCLNILCEKYLYHMVFEPILLARVLSLKVKEDFLKNLNNKKELPNHTKYFLKFLNIQKNHEEIFMKHEENVYTSMYRNNTGYETKLESGKIKKLIAHYYESEI